MNRDDILKAASGKKNAEYEKASGKRGYLLGAFLSFMIGIILFVLEYLLQHRVNASIPALLFIISGTEAVYEGYRTANRLLFFFGFLILLSAALFLIIAILQAVGAL